MENETNTIICMDVGGTETKAAALSVQGAFLGEICHFPSRADESHEALIAHFTTIIHSLHHRHGRGCLAGVRIAFPGPFDYENGLCLLHGLQKFDALYGINLRAELTCAIAAHEPLALGFNLRFINDVGGFALGEMTFGCAQQADRALFVCIGTGCGSAFGLKGKLTDERTLGVPPMGYIYGTPFRSGKIEDYLSKRGLCALAQQFYGKPLEGKELAALALSGNLQARACFSRFGEDIRDALLPCITGYHADSVVLGGQIVKSEKLFTTPLRDALTGHGIALHCTHDTSRLTLQGLTTL